MKSSEETEPDEVPASARCRHGRDGPDSRWVWGRRSIRVAAACRDPRAHARGPDRFVPTRPSSTMFSVSTCATHDGRIRTLDTVRHREASWALYLPRPLQPGHSSREWLLAENNHDGRILAYAVVSWNDADPCRLPRGGLVARLPAGRSASEDRSLPRAVSFLMARNSIRPTRPISLLRARPPILAGWAASIRTTTDGRGANWPGPPRSRSL